MSVVRRRFCIFGCDSLDEHGVPMHRFPNPDKRPDLFAAWVSVVGDKLKESDPKRIYRNKRICDHHFEHSTKTIGGRLIWSAKPTINLHCMQQSIITIVETDHSYCRPRRECLPSRTLVDITNMPGTSSAVNSSISTSVFPIPSGSSSTTCLTASEKSPTRTRGTKLNAAGAGPSIEF